MKLSPKTKIRELIKKANYTDKDKRKVKVSRVLSDFDSLAPGPEEENDSFLLTLNKNKKVIDVFGPGLWFIRGVNEKEKFKMFIGVPDTLDSIRLIGHLHE